jgi:4-hydroxy-tetrahydrodipicolinate synthase
MNLSDYKLWTALITPLSTLGDVDMPTLTKLVQEQEKAGNGLLILGSTAEALNMTLAAKKKIVEHVISLQPRSPIMVGVGGHQLEETLQWIEWLEGQRIHAYLMVTPLYAKPGPVGQFEWFEQLMNKASRPCMLYNVPGRSAVELSLEAVKKLSGHPHFWAIKEASGSVEKFKHYLSAASGKMVYCGDDALMPEFALHGSCGLVSVASNAWPVETHLYVKLCLEKKFDHKDLWSRASHSLFVASNPVPVKRLMFEEGIIPTSLMLPPLSHKDLQDPGPLLRVSEEVRQWYKENSNGCRS